MGTSFLDMANIIHNGSLALYEIMNNNVKRFCHGFV
jgi:hypothetical protein